MKKSKAKAFSHYLGLLLLLFVLLCMGLIVLALFWTTLITLLGLIALCVVIIYILFILGLVYFIEQRPRSLSNAWIMVIRSQLLGFYGLLEFIFSKKGKHDLQKSFIAMNNRLIKSLELKVPFNKLLILTPHCVQKSACGIKVTGTQNHCTMCGMCRVGDLKKIVDYYGVEVAIATGGTLARKVIVEKCPLAIIAVACERDLVSGIRDASKLPVYALANERPFGPCKDTTFNVEELEMMIKELGE